MGVQLLHALVGDAPDGLLLLGDGQQQIYPGGWSLADAGIPVTGRSVLLRHNHRNTVEVLARAASHLQADTYEDLDGQPMTADRGTQVYRHGPEPVELTARTVAEHDDALVAAVQSVLGTSCALGDLAVLLPTRSLVRSVGEVLGAAGIPTVDLRRWDGTPQPAVKIGTYHRAKGLEFRHVFLPRMELQSLTLTAGGREELVRREKAELVRRYLFVAMTRARDSLWLGRAGP